MKQFPLTKLFLTIGMLFAITVVPQSAGAQNQATSAPSGANQQNQASTLPPSTNPADRAIFPAKGQNQEQQMKDQLDAYNWATQQTSWDPHQAYQKLVEQGCVAEQTAEQSKGGLLRGAIGGAAAGVAIGAIAGDTGKGAAIGATAGGLRGGARSRRAQRGADSQKQQAVEEFQRQFAEWDRHYVAAMEGRGYSVK